jgi:Uma2 family endonuclease
VSTVKPDWDEPGYWTEEDYLALGETKNKIELIDGGLWVSPSASNPHNDMLAGLISVMRRAASASGLRAHLTSNLQLGHGRFVIPDIAVGRFERNTAMNSASDAVLVVEITSPGNAVVDRTAKKVLYAEAKINWYLLIEPDFGDYRSVTLQLFRREGGEFALHTEVPHGDKLAADEPFPFEIDTVDLVDF